MKLLFIAPHLSTGGLPQYLLKQIEEFKNENDIYCIEWEDITGNVLVVQKSKIKSILQDKLITLGSNKQSVLDIISSINPDVIHFQEIPEHFIDLELVDKIYSEDRKYFIVVTTHSSTVNPSLLHYAADKFVLVSEWSRQVFFNSLKIPTPCDVWEYPIETIEYDKNQYRKELEFDPNKKHVLHVGLFTPGKNQAHIIEVAKKCLRHNIEFHFVGNQAENFRNYWEPLMKNLPQNCYWHNERQDVHKFYKAADLFYFPSLFELSPISIKEAVSHKLPLFLTRLEVYGDAYDNCATYINNNVDEAADKLLTFLQPTRKDKIPILHILTDIDSDREVRSMQSLTKMTNFDYEYLPIISKRYIDLPPKDSCRHPEKISLEPGGKLTPAHYGCYLGHRKAFEKGLEIDSEYMLIFECDAAINVSPDEFDRKIKFATSKIKEDDLFMFSLGFHNNTNIITKKKDYWISNAVFGAHAYIFPRKSYQKIKEIYEGKKWDVTDLFFTENFSSFKIGFFEGPPTRQTAGYSILDKVYNHDRY